MSSMAGKFQKDLLTFAGERLAFGCRQAFHAFTLLAAGCRRTQGLLFHLDCALRRGGFRPGNDGGDILQDGLPQLLGHGRPVDPDSQAMFGVGQSSGETLVVGAKGRVGSSIGELPQG
jgi:hypothetical protein